MAAEKDGSVIYQHPQSRLFSKMAMLVGFKDTLPTLQVEPKTAVGGEVRVLDRKLEEDEERLKKDNKRWRGIIYLTVAVCLIIFCLVLTQVITSITGSVRPLPNIDVSEPTAGRFAPRPEALVASLAAVNRPVTVRPESEAPRTVRAEVAVAEAQRAEKAEDAQVVVEDLQVELEVAEALSGSPESRSGYVAYAPAPVGGEREETSSSTAATTTTTTMTTTTTPVTVARNRPFFMAMMFPKRPETVARRPPPFLPPRPSLTPPRPRPANQRPPFLTAPPPALPSANQRPPFRTAPPPARPPTNQRPPMHPVLHALLQRQGAPPASFGHHREDPIAADSRPFGLLPLDEDPFSSRMEDILRHMRRLMRTVRPLTRQQRVQEMLPSNVSFSRLLGPPRPFAPPRRPPPTRHVPPQMRNFPTQTRSFSPQTRGFSAPAGLRPGPFRRPISVAPPLPNQRSFAPRPPNQRRPPPRGPAPPRGFATPAGGLSHVPPPNQRQIGGGFGGDFGGDRRFQTRHPTTLVGNPQYSYPETATGIQDIIRYIRGKNQPQNGHGAYNGFSQQPHYNPNTRFSSSDVNNNRFRSGGRRAGHNGANDVSAYYHGGSGGIDGHHGGSGGINSYHGGSGGNERYGAPIYPPGYTNQRLSLASSDRPFRLTLDVYPMDDSDRYGPPQDLFLFDML